MGVLIEVEEAVLSLQSTEVESIENSNTNANTNSNGAKRNPDNFVGRSWSRYFWYSL